VPKKSRGKYYMLEKLVILFLVLMQLLIVGCGTLFFITGKEYWFTVLGAFCFFFYILILSYFYSPVANVLTRAEKSTEEQ
jgi:hypothetical protein